MTLAALMCGPVMLIGVAFEAFARYEKWTHVELSLSGSVRDFRFRIDRWPKNREELRQFSRKEFIEDLDSLSQKYSLEIGLKNSSMKEAVYEVKTKFGSRDLVIKAR